MNQVGRNKQRAVTATTTHSTPIQHLLLERNSVNQVGRNKQRAVTATTIHLNVISLAHTLAPKTPRSTSDPPWGHDHDDVDRCAHVSWASP